MIDANVPFRGIGDCALQVWYDEAQRVGSPIPVNELWQAAIAASPHGALALAQGIKETQLGKTAPAANNFLGLMADGKFAAFDSWAACAAEFRRRLDDLAYKGGVYAPADMPLLAYVVTYVGGPGCWTSGGRTCANGETWDGAEGGSLGLYLRQTVARLNSYLESGEDGMAFGNVPRPAWTERLVPDRANSAWNDLGPRTVRGVVYHRMLGTLWGTDAWFRGGGGASALTDFGMDHRTNETLRWNPHDGKAAAGVSANRAPWASGPWERPPGDGIAFVDKYGVNGINRDLVSIEISGNYGDALSSGAIEQLALLTAWLADQARVPWDQFPVNPATGLVFTYFHNEFTKQKPCPGDVVMNATPGIVERTKAILKQYQAGAAPEPQPPTPDPPLPTWPGKPAWLPDELVKTLFPEATPEGPRTRAWLAYCTFAKRAPARKAFLNRGTPDELIQFDDGLLIDLKGNRLGDPR